MMSLCAMPMSSAAPTAVSRPLKRATNAAAIAGTTSRLVSVAESLTIGAARITASAASTVAITQLPAAIHSVRMPMSNAPRWFSATARVARPNRVYRAIPAITTAATMATPVSHNRSS